MAGAIGRSGGSRIGAGRPAKSRLQKWLDGNAGKRGQKAAKPVSSPLRSLSPPEDLPSAQKTVWLELAPHAANERTLTPATANAFRDLCEAIVVRDTLLARIEKDGWTFLKVSVDGAGVEHQEIKAHPLIARWQGLMQRVETGKLRFRLIANGKELVPVEEPKDEWQEFETVQ